MGACVRLVAACSSRFHDIQQKMTIKPLQIQPLENRHGVGLVNTA